MRQLRNALVAAAMALVLAAPASADRIELQDGRTLEAEVIGEDEQSITVEIWGLGSSLTQRISKSQITTWHKPSREGQPYVVIPVFGVIGQDITVDVLRAGLAEARAASPKYVILAIDSPGGNIAQMAEMLDVLDEASKTLSIIAYVKSAYSAAAVIAMSCPKVYLKPGATIGATVPFRMTENGPADVDAKFRSVIEARMRAANEHGGHADLLIRGMSELDLELFLDEEDRRPRLSTNGPGKLIKSKGQILTLTADEAVECGFARIAPTMKDLGDQVCGGAWHEVNRRAFNTILGMAELQRRRDQEAMEKRERLIAWRNAVVQIKPQWDGIESRVGELMAKVVAAENAIVDLTAKCNWEMQQINLEYQQAVISARKKNDSDAAIAHAVEVANKRTAAARQQLQTDTARLQSDNQAAQAEIGQLREKQKQLLASLPSD